MHVRTQSFIFSIRKKIMRLKGSIECEILQSPIISYQSLIFTATPMNDYFNKCQEILLRAAHAMIVLVLN